MLTSPENPQRHCATGCRFPACGMTDAGLMRHRRNMLGAKWFGQSICGRFPSELKVCSKKRGVISEVLLSKQFCFANRK